MNLNVSSYFFENRSELDAAIDSWISNEVSATETYGDINTWDVSNITDFSNLFSNKSNFNSDISVWNVSNGTSFYSMFDNATSFNQDIGGWDIMEVILVSGSVELNPLIKI